MGGAAVTSAFAAGLENFIDAIDQADAATKAKQGQDGLLDGEEIEDLEAFDERYRDTGGREVSGCPDSNAGGRISMLGVESDMGPSRPAGPRRATLDPRHPLWEERGKLDTRMAELDQQLRTQAPASGCSVPVSNVGPGPYTPDWKERQESAERWIEESAINHRDRANDVQRRRELLATVQTADARAGVQRDLDNDLQKLGEAETRLRGAEQTLSCLQLLKAQYESAMAPLSMALAGTDKLIAEKQYPCP